MPYQMQKRSHQKEEKINMKKRSVKHPEHYCKGRKYEPNLDKNPPCFPLIPEAQRGRRASFIQDDIANCYELFQVLLKKYVFSNTDFDSHK